MNTLSVVVSGTIFQSSYILAKQVKTDSKDQEVHGSLVNSVIIGRIILLNFVTWIKRTGSKKTIRELKIFVITKSKPRS